MRKLCLAVLAVFVLASCAGFDTTMDVLDIFVGDPVIHSGVVSEYDCHMSAMSEDISEMMTIKFEDGHTIDLPKCSPVSAGKSYALKESDSRGFYLERNGE